MNIEESYGKSREGRYCLTNLEIDIDSKDSSLLLEFSAAKDKIREIVSRKTDTRQCIGIIVSTSEELFASTKETIVEWFENDTELTTNLHPGSLRISILAIGVKSKEALHIITLSNSPEMKLVEIPNATNSGCQYSLTTLFVLTLYTGILIGLYIFYFKSVTQPGSLVSEILYYHPFVFIAASVIGIPLSYFVLGFGCELIVRYQSRPKKELES